jgi:hypothetical protein
LGDEFVGNRGTVIWCDRPWFDRRAGAWKEWIYCLSLGAFECYRSFLESDLEPTGEFDIERSQLGDRYEISDDTVMNDDDKGAVEGSYRLPGNPSRGESSVPHSIEETVRDIRECAPARFVAT